MAEADLLEEIDELKEKIEGLVSQIETLKEDSEYRISELEDKCDKIRETTEKEWRVKLRIVEKECQEKLDALTAEVDNMRSAFSGDTNGWEEKTTKSGQVYYENSNTGEVREEEPEVLYIAKAMKRVEEAEAIKAEFAQLKTTYAACEKKRREYEITLNKNKTEMNSLKSIDKLWKESAKTVFNSLLDSKAQFDAQIDQIVDGLSIVSKTSKRCHIYIPSIRNIKQKVSDLQKKLVVQDAEMVQLNGKIRNLSADLADKNKKVERLSKGLEDEIERLTKPMRDKMSECMLMVMKEKAARAQERRELADLWPSDTMLPTLLMKYRCLDENEKKRRLDMAKEAQASLALTLEIQANVAESKMWEMKYDDYGRPFYQHKTTNETRPEEPEIVNYKPPPGRDEMGNPVIVPNTDMLNWTILTDYKGEVCYQHKETNEIRYIPPGSYSKIPNAKSKEQMVSESAQLVLAYIKDKIKQHVDELEGKKAKSESTEPEDPATSSAAPSADSEDLSVYHYDIECVEMLATLFDMSSKGISAETIAARNEARKVLNDNIAIRKFDPSLYESVTVAKINTDEITVPELRDFVERLAVKEEDLEKKLKKTREDLRDFSFLLVEKATVYEAEIAEQERVKRKEKLEAERKKLAAEIRNLRKQEKEKKKLQLTNGNDADDDGTIVTLEASTEEKNNVEPVAVVSDVVKPSTEALVPPSSSADTNPDAIAAPVITAPIDDEVSGGVDEAKSETSEITEVDLHGVVGVESKEMIYLLGDPDIDDMPLSEGLAEISRTSEVLSNMALYCGFSETHIDQIYEDNTNEFSLNNLDSLDKDNAVQDDVWLTKSFFISIDKNRVDAIKEATDIPYDPVMGLVGCKHLHTTRLNLDAVNVSSDIKSQFFSPSVLNVNGNLHSSQMMWRARQLMAEILRYQFQQEAVREAIKSRLIGISSAYAARKNQSHVNIIRDDHFLRGNTNEIVKFSIIKAVFTDVRSFKTFASDDKQVLQFQLGSWVVQTTEKSNAKTTIWDNLSYDLYIPREKFVLNSLTVEILDKSPAIHDVRRGCGGKNLAVLLNANTGKILTQEILLYDRFGAHVGQTLVTMTADLIQKLPFEQDSNGINNLEVNNYQYVPLHVTIDTGLRDKLFEQNEKQMKLQKEMEEKERRALATAAFLAENEAKENEAKENEAKENEAKENEAKENEAKENDDEVILAEIPAADSVEEISGVDNGHVVESDSRDNDEVESASIGGQTGTVVATINEDNATLLNSLSAEQSAMVALSVSTSSSNEKDVFSGVFPSLAAQQNDFAELVSDLRGDSDRFIRMMIGDVTLQEVLNLGYRPTSSSTVKKLPNIENATKYMLKKREIQEESVLEYVTLIRDLNDRIDVKINELLEQSESRYNESKKKYQQLMDLVEKIKGDISVIATEVEDLRNPLSQPIEPEFEELRSLPYVPNLPVTGALDEKGKKKKAIPTNDFKELITSVESGGLDGVPDWPFQVYWPTQAQMLKLNKVITDRNKVLDDGRVEELAGRDKMIDNYKLALDKWEIDEKRRKMEFQKAKKDSRKAYIRLESALERADRLSTEYKSLEMNAKCISEMRDLHASSKGNFQVLRMKHYLESKRHRETLRILKKKLVRALDARRRALDMPNGARNEVHFEELRNSAEQCLRTLRLEIVEIKDSLVTEGLRLRLLYDEEYSAAMNEYNRVKMFSETLIQRDCVEKILARNLYEVLHLYVDMEKLRIIEADKDDRGMKYTVDNKGERYSAEKVWDSEEVKKCQRLIDIVMAKIVLAEGILTTTASTQKCLLNVMQNKWGNDFTPVRHSWVENSDYERAKRLTNDCISWMAHQRDKLREREKADFADNKELTIQLSTAIEQNNINLQVHDNQTTDIANSALGMVSVLQMKLSNLKTEFVDTQTKLEKTITELSRELQGVREKALIKDLQNEEKAKILWAFITTLQRACQTISARMEMVLEERDSTLIKSKLEQDKLRHDLRAERRHCANLLFVIHGLRGSVQRLQFLLTKVVGQARQDEGKHKLDKQILRKQNWEHIFCFTRLCTDVDSLFEFFASRLANLAGSRKSVNDALAKSGAAVVLAALCQSPRPLIRKYAARAIGGMGWDSFVETRILIWDCVLFWRAYKDSVLQKEKEKILYENGYKEYEINGNEEAILNIEGRVDEFQPSENLSLRSLIKQRRQWALRAARRVEGPNNSNMKLINVKDGVIQSLLELCIKDGAVDWEIARNAALAICVASYEVQNHIDMTNNANCVHVLVKMCYESDAEVQTHAAVTIANLCHKDENAQDIFGKANAIPALLHMCQQSVVDLLEASTAALANITCYHDGNCKRVLECDGVHIMVTLITTAYSQNILDLDQNDEVHANAVEMLANVSRFSAKDTTKYFDGPVIDALIVMCAAINKMVKRHTPLVLGNIGQSDRCREEISDRGGIEALFLLLEDPDNIIQSNTLWALCNMMWYPPNQERAGRFITEVIAFLDSNYIPVMSNAAILLANILYYNNNNRIRLLEIDGAIEKLIQICSNFEEVSVVEACLRSLLSLSYLDNVGLWLGTEAKCVPMFISKLHVPYISKDIMRFALEILSNLCIHHENRKAIIDNNGIEAIVNLYSDSDKYIQDLAASIIAILEDVTPPEVLARIKSNIGLERMVTLVTDADPLVRAVAAESIGEGIWGNKNNQKRVLDIGGVDALLSVISNPTELVESLLPGLWSLRNLLHNNLNVQNQFNYRDGITVVVHSIGRSLSGIYMDQTEKILEAELAVLVTAILNHEKNARRLLSVGLEILLDIADGKLYLSSGTDAIVKKALSTEGIVALSKYLLSMLAPYNYVVCKNCHKKQDLHGQTCLNCGYRLLVEDIPPVKEKKGITQLASKESKESLKDLRELKAISPTKKVVLNVLPTKK